jgi:2'-5' RNA ligase
VTEAADVRLFTALWPSPAVRARLAAVRDAWRWPPGAKPVPDEKLHATLHFIGRFPRDRLEALGCALDAVEVAPLRLGLAASEVWRGGIAVATLAEAPALLSLHARLGAALADLEVALEDRPYRPHVTMARTARGAAPPATLPALDWRPEGFALVASRGGAYHVLETWTATGRRSPPPAPASGRGPG